MSFSFSKIGTKLSIAKHLMSKDSQLADDPKSLAAILPLLTGADDSANYELTASGHGGQVGSLNLRAVGAIVAMLICALLLLPAVCLAQAPGACLPNACGPVQAMPPLPQAPWHGYPQPYVNPFQYIAPLVVNFATAPRMVVNPLTGQPQLMSPGQWILVNAGTPAQTYTWQPLPVWPLGSEKPNVNAKKPTRIRPLHRLVIHLHLL